VRKSPTHRDRHIPNFEPSSVLLFLPLAVPIFFVIFFVIDLVEWCRFYYWFASLFQFTVWYLEKRNRYNPASREEQADLLNANDVPLAVLPDHTCLDGTKSSCWSCGNLICDVSFQSIVPPHRKLHYLAHAL
jgi:hypothetical protein